MNPSDPSPQVPVAIIGMGCLFPQAEGLARYWANIRKGVDAISEVPESHWRVADYFDSNPKAPDRTYAHRGGFLMPVDFPPMEFGIAPNAIEATDTTQLLGLMVARRALDDAGYGGDRPLDRDRVSVILGVTGTLELVLPLGARLGHPIWRRALEAAGVDERTTEDVVRRISESYVGWQENSFPGLLGNVAAGRIANRLDLHGTNCVVDAACASSLGAINLSMLELATGRCDLAVTGGLDTFNDIFMYMCFSKTPALSPTGDARPFDAEADGTILGEGLGVVVLKRLADAKRDGDRVYAVIRSVGTSSDGKGQAVYAPSAAGQAKALRRAYAMAGISPATVELIEAHGTGTRVGDAIELSALEEVFRGARLSGPWCALGSVKSQVGHTKAAAGAAGLIKAALALHHKVLPPTLKVRRPMGSLAGGDSPFYLNAEARPWLSSTGGPRRAAVSAFGFGGSNFHCLLEEAEPEKPGVDWDGDVQILAFSADEPAEVVAALEPLDGLTDWPEIRAAAAKSRAQFRSSHRYRLVLVAVRGEEGWVDRLAEARSRIEEANRAAVPDGAAPSRNHRLPTPKGRVFVGTGSCPGALAMLFPGQGSQYVGMLRELACLFPAMQGSLAQMNEAVGDGTGRISDRIHPPSAFDEAGQKANEDALRATGLAQPAIGAVSLGVLRILEAFGVRADLVGGHSFGELTALRAAGRIDDVSLAMLAQRRGALMAGCSSKGSGAMLAVFAPIETVSSLIRTHGLDLVIASKNAPRQCVLSGSAGEIERGRQILADQGITTRHVPVSAAFHSRFVAEAEAPFRKTVETVSFRTSTIPVYANTTAEPYPDDSESTRDLLAGQIARPVEFVAQIEAMYRRGARTFLEVGPDARLTGLVRAILDGRDHVAIAVDASRGSAGNVHDLACSLATLAALGYAVDLNHWDEGEPGRVTPTAKPGLTVRISGANARPKDRPAEGPAVKPAPVSLPLAESPSPQAVVPWTPRFSLSETLDPTMPDTQPRHHAENHRTMNQPERIPSHHSNGHASSHALHRPQAVELHEPTTRLGPHSQDVAAPTDLAFAFHAAQENLAALQRLAEQTADLHRQFLEGQEKAQQTFFKLLERQQHLSHAMPESNGEPTPAAPTQRTFHEGPSARRQVSSTPVPEVVEDTRFVAKPAPGPANSVPVGKTSGEGHVNIKPCDVEPRRPAAQAAARSEDRGHRQQVASSDHPVTLALVEVVAEKTGYPADILDLDMQLDADLGIDSIKRVEILSALQERHPELPALPPEQLGSFRTLRSIAEFLGRDRIRSQTDARGSVATQSPSVPEKPGAVSVVSPALAEVLLETVAEKTGYPAEMLDLGMRLDADLGIDSIKRVEILSALQDRFPGLPPAGPERIGSLATLRNIVEFLGEAAEPGPAAAAGSHFPVLAQPPTLGHPITTTVRPEPDLSSETITRALLAAVAEKTGYPVEMLELDMRLDADLGIDSIKRVEILSAVQERLPEATAVGPEQTGTLQTLRQIVEFLSSPPRPDPDPAHGGQVEDIQPGVIASRNGESDHSERRGSWAQPPRNGHWHSSDGPTVGLRLLEPRAVPISVSERREAVNLPRGATIWITDEGSALTEGVRSNLDKRGYRARVIPAGGIDPSAAGPDPCGLIVIAPRGPILPNFINGAFRTLREAGPALLRSGQRGGASLLTVSRLDGVFGLGGLAREIDPTSGALAGLAKTAGHEWSGVHCKAVDLDPALESSGGAASAIVDELLTSGPAEVGLGASGRMAVELGEAGATGLPGGRTPRVGRGDLVVITGGARGITAEVAVALAEAFQPRLLLLGRSPEPSAAEDDPFADCRDEAQLRRALLSRSDRSMTPQAIGEQARQIMARREVRRNLDRIAAAGSPVVYRSVDVRNQADVRQIIDRTREAVGPVRGLIHGAGVLADRKLVEQSESQFTQVYQTKVDGLQYLYGAIESELLEFLFLFSSSTARFGRSGQVAYAAANEYLNKWAQQASVRMPHCRVVSFNWGPWAGGMVTDALRPLFEKEGLALIPPRDGAKLVVDEIRNPRPEPGPVEIVVLAENPPAEPSSSEDSSDSGTISGVSWGSDTTPAGPRGTLAFRRVVDVETLRILGDHVIDGRAVLPMAMILEWVAEAALQRNPGLVVCGVDALRLFKGVVLSGREPTTIDLLVGKGTRIGAEFVVPVELRGTLASGRDVIHARADVILGDHHPVGARRSIDRPLSSYPLSLDDMYRDVLFHGPTLHGIELVEGCDSRAIVGRVATSPPPAEWVDRPSRSRWLTDPLAIDSVFQLMVVWCREHRGANSLPTAVGRYRQFRPGFGDGPVRVLAEIRKAVDARAVADIEILDARGELVARLDSYECVVDITLNQAFRRNQLIAPSSVVAG
ncbi:MAG: SDR family NAD(P)-dependent oxidoreductase [Isosphaeraceae bacterium]